MLGEVIKFSVARLKESGPLVGFRLLFLNGLMTKYLGIMSGTSKSSSRWNINKTCDSLAVCDSSFKSFA